MLKPLIFSRLPEFKVHQSVHAGRDVIARVNELWHDALLLRPSLFDGPVVTVSALDETGLTIVPTTYRYLLAAKQDPAVHAALHLRPLAVSGFLSCRDGFVFGLRAAENTEAAGFWELVPSGGVNLVGGKIDLQAQILQELESEIGLRPGRDDITVSPPCGLIEDLESGVIDVVMPIRTALSAAQIRIMHQNEGSSEYTRLQFASSMTDIPSEGVLLPASAMILDLFWEVVRPLQTAGFGAPDLTVSE